MTTFLPIAALLMSSGFLLMAGGLHGLLLPLQGTAAGFTTVELGLIGTGWSVGFISGCLIVPWIVRRAGHVRGFSTMASLAGITILLNAMIISPEAWIVLRAVTGFCFAGAAMVVESWLNERATPGNRGTIFSVYQMVVFASATIGQLLLMVSAPMEFFFFAVGAILYCLAIMPTALSTAQHPRPLKATRLDLRALYENSPVAVIGCFLVGMVNGAFGTLGAVYGSRVGLPVASTALMMAGAYFGGSLLQFPLGKLSDRVDRRKVLIGVAAGAIIAGSTIVLVHPRDPWMLIGLVVLFGAMIYPLYGITVAHANDFAAPEDFVKIAGGLLLLLGCGMMVGPVLASLAMEALQPEALFGFCALVDLCLIAYTVYRISRRGQPEETEAFQGIPGRALTPESANLDPRAEPQPPESTPPDSPQAKPDSPAA